jgi:hypothetical protein
MSESRPLRGARPSRLRRNGLSLAAAMVALVGGGTFAAGLATPAGAATPPPHRLIVIQGADPSCNQPSTYMSNYNTTTGKFTHPVVEAIHVKDAAEGRYLRVSPVSYQTCSTYDFGKGRWLTGSEIINRDAKLVATVIRQNLSDITDPAVRSATKVDILGESLGGLLSRRCIVMAHQPAPLNAGYEECTQVEDWIGFVTPNHGSDATTSPPTETNSTDKEWVDGVPSTYSSTSSPTCSAYAWTNPCAAQSDGAHLTNFLACPILFPLAQEVCGQLKPGSETIMSMSEGKYGYPLTMPTPTRIIDDTPGTINYTTFYSYEDEVVFFKSTKAIGSEHPSKLTGATNIRVPRQTHSSMGRATPGGSRLIAKRQSNGLPGAAVETVPSAGCGTPVAERAALVATNKISKVVADVTLPLSLCVLPTPTTTTTTPAG